MKKLTANPFSLSYGISPGRNYIPRQEISSKIYSDFTSILSTNHVYMLTGARGSGKTVMMSTIAQQLKNKEGYTIIELNSSTDLLEDLATKLFGLLNVQSYFIGAKIDLSASFDNNIPATTHSSHSKVVNIEDAIAKMLENVNHRKERILVLIDDIGRGTDLSRFSKAFLSLVRMDLPIYMMITALYDDIYEASNIETQMFLRRLPRTLLGSLSVDSVKNGYKNILGVGDEEAERMADLTKGYSVAYQILGYLYYENINTGTDILPEYDWYLKELVYDNIWRELSEDDKKIFMYMAKPNSEQFLASDSSKEMLKSLSKRKDTLLNMGLIVELGDNQISFALPRFKEYVIRTAFEPITDSIFS